MTSSTECENQIVPTPVGVNRHAAQHHPVQTDCPHARGGEPLPVAVTVPVIGLSPRPWG